MRTQVMVAALAMTVVSAGVMVAKQAQGVESRPPNATGQTPAFRNHTRAPERAGRADCSTSCSTRRSPRTT